MVEELEERERAFKKAKVDKKNEEIKVQMETERIKEEGRKLREQKEKEMRMREEERTKGDVEEEDMDLPPELRMFFSFGSGFVANLFYRPTRYNYSSKIFIEGSSGAHDTRSYSQATIAIRSPRHRIDRSFAKSAQEECWQATEDGNSTGAFQADRRCVFRGVC